MIYFTCPSCQRIGQAADQLAGQVANCPACGQSMLVPHFILTSRPATPASQLEPLPSAAAPSDGLLRFFCPGCRKKLKVPREALQTAINCKRCGQRVDVASAVRRSPAPPPRESSSPTSESVLAYLPDLIPEDGGRYYYIKNNQQLGPVTGQALRQMALLGQLQPTDWVWKPGFAKWKHASKAKGLFPPANTPPPAPPVRPPSGPQLAPPLPTQRPSAIAPDVAPLPAAAGNPSDPQHARAFLHRGMAMAEQQDHDRALADLDAALRLDPQNAKALAARGLIYAKSKGDYQRGLADLSVAIRFAPHEPALYELRAVLYHEMAAPARAQADERKAAELRGQS